MKRKMVLGGYRYFTRSRNTRRETVVSSGDLTHRKMPLKELLDAVDRIAGAPDPFRPGDGFMSDKGCVTAQNGNLMFTANFREEHIAFTAQGAPESGESAFSLEGRAMADVIKVAIELLAEGEPLEPYLRANATFCEVAKPH